LQHIEQLLIDIKESLEGQIHDGFASVDSRLDQINSRFDTQALRLDRQAALIQTGSHFSARMTEWSEKADVSLNHKDTQISELTRRIEEIERNRCALQATCKNRTSWHRGFSE
jgi:hypothetical protein